MTSSQTVINLGSKEEAFSQGGNRLIFLDPDNTARCIKVLRADRLPELKRREKSFPSNLKPLSAFDDNLQEYKTFKLIENTIGQAAFSLIPYCYGFVETNHGRGILTELIKDEDGKISISLKQYVWQFGFNNELKRALAEFQRRWQELGIPSRNLLLHNIVVQQDDSDIKRLVVIDGLGWPDLLPLAYWFQPLGRRKAQRKVTRLNHAIDRLLEKKSNNEAWGYHGWLEEEQRIIHE